MSGGIGVPADATLGVVALCGDGSGAPGGELLPGAPYEVAGGCGGGGHLECDLLGLVEPGRRRGGAGDFDRLGQVGLIGVVRVECGVGGEPAADLHVRRAREQGAHAAAEKVVLYFHRPAGVAEGPCEIEVELRRAGRVEARGPRIVART